MDEVMNEICTFYLSEDHSPSGYFAEWSTDGGKVPVECPYRGYQTNFFRFTVVSGQYLFLNMYGLDGQGEDEWKMILIRVPDDPR